VRARARARFSICEGFFALQKSGYAMIISAMKIIFSILILLLSVGCNQKVEKDGTRPRVLTSIPPYAYFVQRIAGDRVEIQMIVPPGTDPHVFEPTPAEVDRASKGQLWLKIGEPFESKMAKVIKERNPALKLLDLWQEIPLEKGCHHCDHAHGDDFDGLDRHLWLSPKIAQKQAVMIARELIRINPSHQAEYEKNLKDFLNDLDALDGEIEKLLAPLSKQAILVTHPAFTYFCRDYDLVQLSIDSEGKDPLPQHLTELLKQVKELKISSVITQPQYGMKGANLMAKELGLQVTSIDPYSTDYLSNLRTLAHLVADDH
jgi:zinc transport system substrate-binding protein